MFRSPEKGTAGGQTQTWVCSLVHSKANLPLPGCGEGKCNVDPVITTVAPSQESKQLVFRRHKLAASFQKKVFKDRVRERDLWDVWSAFGHSSDWLGGEVMMSQHHQPPGSDHSEVYVLVGTCS